MTHIMTSLKLDFLSVIMVLNSLSAFYTERVKVDKHLKEFRIYQSAIFDDEKSST